VDDLTVNRVKQVLDHLLEQRMELYRESRTTQEHTVIYFELQLLQEIRQKLVGEKYHRVQAELDGARRGQ